MRVTRPIVMKRRKLLLSSQPEETQETEKNDESDSEEEADIAILKILRLLRQKLLIHVNIAKVRMYDTAVMKWVDNHKICPLYNHKIPLNRKHGEHSLRRCYDCGAITHKNEKTSKITYYPPSNEEDVDDY